MELRVLGAVEAHDGSDPIALRPAERRLLAALVACRPAPVRYDALAEAIWGEAVPRSATRSLQTHVLRVRAALGVEAVQTVAGGYQLGDGVAVDADAFMDAGPLRDDRGQCCVGGHARRMGGRLEALAG